MGALGTGLTFEIERYPSFTRWGSGVNGGDVVKTRESA